MDVDRLRSETPGCEERIHLNNAGSALMPKPVIEAIQNHITLESRIGGYEAADARRDAMQGAYESVAELLGTRPGNIAFTESATASFIQALSSIPFERDDVILTTRNDYVSNQIQFLSLKARLGVQVLRAPDRTEGGVDVHALADLVRRHRPKLVCVSHVPTNSGLVQDVRAVGSVCQDEGVLYLVDACQSIGQMPVDVGELRCDFLSATSRKFLRGPRGALVSALRARRINANAQIRAYAVIDYDAKGVATSLRLSPHDYNTEDEIDQTVSAIRGLVLQQAASGTEAL